MKIERNKFIGKRRFIISIFVGGCFASLVECGKLGVKHDANFFFETEVKKFW